MFLIVPKTKTDNTAHTRSSTASETVRPRHQPLAKVTRASRVQIACDRCRIKKVKCDGETPCLRCTQDKAPCIATKKMSSDPKEVMRQYVDSIGSQQLRLIQALQKVHRHARQLVDEKDMEEIVEIVQSCGYDFEGVPETSDRHRRIIGIFGRSVNDPAGVEDEEKEGTREDAVGHDKNIQPGPAASGESVPNKKRKREPEPATRREYHRKGEAKGVSCANDDRSPSLDQRAGSGIGLLNNINNNEKEAATSLALTDNYWDLDNYFNSIILGQIHPQVSESLPEPASDQSFPPDVRKTFDPSFALSPSTTPNSTSLPPSHALPTSCPYTQPADIGWPETDQVFDSAPPYTTNPKNADDWGSAVWWDPSHLFDFDIDASSLQSTAI